MTEQTRLRDARRSYQFWVDDAIIDHFGAELGPYGLAVYVVLARRAKQGKAFPSVKRLAKDSGMSRASAVRALTELVRLHLIKREQRRDDDGDLDTTLYTLLDLSTYHAAAPIPPTSPMAPESQGRLSENLPVGSAGADGRLSRSHKGSSLKDPHLEGSSPSVSPPDGGDTHTGAEVEFQQGRRTRKAPCPGGLAEQAALAAELLTPSLLSWASEHVPTLDPHHEFTRWMAHSLADGKRYADYGEAFKSWLLHPLTQQQTTWPQSTLEARSQEARAAARRFILEDDDGHLRQTVVFNDPTNGLGNLRRSLERHAPAGLLVGTQGCLHACGI